MKRVLIILLTVVSIILVYVGTQAGGSTPVQKTLIRKSCTGYEIIEAGIGINCYGDTIKLTKRSGFYEVASNTTPISNPAL